VQKYAHDRLPTNERPFHKKSRTTSVQSRLPKLGLILLVATITAAIAVQTAYGCDGNNNNDNNGNCKKAGGGVAASINQASGRATIQLQGTKATLNSFSLSGAPPNVPLIIHIHAQNKEDPSPAAKCKGLVLFAIKDPDGTDPVIKTDGNGKFSINKNNPKEFASPDPKLPPPDVSKLDTWYVNVHDANQPLPPDPTKPGPQKFKSIACGLIKVGGDPTKGSAKLVADTAPPPPVANSRRRPTVSSIRNLTKG